LRPDDYCRDRAAPPGSDLHYSLLGLPPPARQTIVALHALRQELLGIAADRKDPGIARQKLDWWRQELARLAAGRPQHPVTQALANQQTDDGMVQTTFDELLAAAHMDLDYDAYPGFDQLVTYGHRAGSSVALSHTRILGYRDQQTAAFAHEAGVALLLLQLLYNVRDDALRGRFYIPDDELQRFGVNHDDLLGTQTTPGLADLFRFQAERIRAYRQRALQHLTETERGAQRHHLALIELGSVLLDEIEADGFRLLQQRIRLTPLRKLWIVWRTLRREQRRQRTNLRTIESLN
jgi:phytoene synthase